MQWQQQCGTKKKSSSKKDGWSIQGARKRTAQQINSQFNNKKKLKGNRECGLAEFSYHFCYVSAVDLCVFYAFYHFYYSADDCHIDWQFSDREIHRRHCHFDRMMMEIQRAADHRPYMFAVPIDVSIGTDDGVGVDAPFSVHSENNPNFQIHRSTGNVDIRCKLLNKLKFAERCTKCNSWFICI